MNWRPPAAGAGPLEKQRGWTVGGFGVERAPPSSERVDDSGPPRCTYQHQPKGGFWDGKH